MLEPFETSNQENNKVKMDREVLHSMMKSWNVPRTTGTLSLPDQNLPAEKKHSSLGIPTEGSNSKIT